MYLDNWPTIGKYFTYQKFTHSCKVYCEMPLLLSVYAVNGKSVQCIDTWSHLQHFRPRYMTDLLYLLCTILSNPAEAAKWNIFPNILIFFFLNAVIEDMNAHYCNTITRILYRIQNSLFSSLWTPWQNRYFGTGTSTDVLQIPALTFLVLFIQRQDLL